LIGISGADPSFDTLFEEALVSSGLTQQEYRDMATANVLGEKMVEKFQEELPETADSIHYRQIIVDDQAKADEIKGFVEGGGDFTTLAAEHSTDAATKDIGGDTGWTPRGVLGETLENLLFSLEDNQVVTYPGSNNVTLYQMIEKDTEHPIEDDDKPTLAAAAYQDWLEEKRDLADVVNEIDTEEGDVDKIVYVIEHAGLTAQ
jgi:parvulin-like peptidyl-prolyl isomerase